MSNALAIAGVTAVLRDLLDSGMIEHAVTDAMGLGVTVSAVAPDTIHVEGAEAKPQLNIFMHQATPNAAWRNMGLPSRDGNGNRLSNPPLALDLHYLVTAYGVTDLQAEVLLGYAMQLLHETPMLARDRIRVALNPPSMPVDGGLLPDVYQALRASDLADQIEQIKIDFAPMNVEDMSKLWSAMQAHYRPTAAYDVSVVLIEATQPARAPLPVLTRGPSEPSAFDPAVKRERGVVVRPDLMPPFPEIETIQPPKSQIAAHLGDTLTLNGHHLDGSNHRLLLILPRFGIEEFVEPAETSSPTTASFVLDDEPGTFPAGHYLAALQLVRPGETEPRTSNLLTLTIAPQITSFSTPPEIVFPDSDGTAVVSIDCKPDVLPTQRATLILGGLEVLADPHPVPANTLIFTVLNAPVGTHWVRLRVDGIESQLVNRDVSPPVFFEHQIEIA
jgi:hypothetical protein